MEFQTIGKSIWRIDGEKKVRGQALYTIDLKKDGMLHGRILRSPHPHARLRRVDTLAAAKFPGVHAVISRDDFPEGGPLSPYFGRRMKDKTVVALDKVRHVGDVVAAVAATVALVAFLPDDLDLIKRGPVYRREYLDDLAAQLWPAAGAEQADYERVLRQRNALLRRDGRHANPTTLDVLDERLCGLASAVLSRRLATADLVAPQIESFYAELGETPARVRFTYAAAGVAELPLDADAAALAGAKRLAMARLSSTTSGSARVASTASRSRTTSSV